MNVGGKKNRTVLILVMTGLMAAVPAHSIPCQVTFGQLLVRKAKSLAQPALALAARPVGLIIGSANDVTITLLKMGTGVLPVALGRWLPLVNEMANVAATSTGRRWIYDGMSKQLADGVALGAILGHSLTAGMHHGPVTGGLTLAANLGLTYWFPNKYFHTIMVDLPNKIPDKYSKTKAFAKSGVGQAAIGVSLIVMIEQILQKAEALAEMAPRLWSDEKKKPEEKEAVPVPTEVKVKASLAAFLMDGALFRDSNLSDEEKDAVLVYLTGATRENGLFPDDTRRLSRPFPDVTLGAERLGALRDLLKTPSLGQLLTPRQIDGVNKRLDAFE